ncbi:hypothetical protein M514_02758, partial [Trichuris suis]
MDQQIALRKAIFSYAGNGTLEMHELRERRLPEAYAHNLVESYPVEALSRGPTETDDSGNVDQPKRISTDHWKRTQGSLTSW